MHRLRDKSSRLALHRSFRSYLKLSAVAWQCIRARLSRQEPRVLSVWPAAFTYHVYCLHCFATEGRRLQVGGCAVLSSPPQTFPAPADFGRPGWVVCGVLWMLKSTWPTVLFFYFEPDQFSSIRGCNRLCESRKRPAHRYPGCWEHSSVGCGCYCEESCRFGHRFPWLARPLMATLILLLNQPLSRAGYSCY